MIGLNVRKRLIGSEGPFELRLEFTVPRGRLVILYGASGAGKTTLLRMLAGLENPDGGCIEVDGETWFNQEQRVCVPPQKRSVGFVFQHYALFPSMTVRRNLEFAAGRRQDPRVDMLLEMVELKELQHRYPDKLSGGQQQRVALARALIRQPKILLLDEPLSALDETMRGKLQEAILNLHQKLGLTSILVSHDRAEVLRMADRVLAIHDGQLTFEGLSSDLFHNHQTGDCCHLRGEVISMSNDDGTVAIIATTGEGNKHLEIRLDKRQLRQIFDKEISPRTPSHGSPS